jgi:MFS family permease
LASVNKKYLSYLIKAAIIILAYAFIYHQFIKKGADIKRFEMLLDHIGQKQVLLIVPLIFYLMLVNWVLESLKWQYLTRKLIPISVWKAVECVFCGLTWAIFTPNRLGEYGGRVMFLPPRKRVYGVFAMAVGSFGQNVITNVLGTVAILWFTATFLHFNIWVYLCFLILGIAYIAIFLICYFHMKWLVFLLDRVPFIKKYHRFFEVMGEYKFKELFIIMLFCMARFFTFSLQYYVLIHLFIPQLGAFEILMMTFIVFFIQSALPSLDLLDVAVRSETAIIVFAYITNQQVAVVAVFSAIWIINLIIPAIIGTFFNLKLNFFDRNA